MITAMAVLAALLLDALLGEPRRGHPLALFGGLAGALERALNRPHWPTGGRRLGGLLALFLLVAPLGAIAGVLAATAGGWIVEVVVLYFALGLRSLGDHGNRVVRALADGDLAAARTGLAMMVSRDTGHLGASRIAAGTTESVLENGTDAVFGALFWFIVAGAPGVVVYRLVNTLDAMWGYRTPRFVDFGWAAARLDDVLNWVPARLTVATYVLMAPLFGGRPMAAWRCACRQGGRSESPNAGLVMATGAGALGVRLGGTGRYHGALRWRPRFGYGRCPDAAAIRRALRLVQGGVLLWLLLMLAAAVAMEWW